MTKRALNNTDDIRPQSVSFTRNNNNFIETSDSSYEAVAKVEYLGSDVLG